MKFDELIMENILSFLNAIEIVMSESLSKKTFFKVNWTKIKNRQRFLTYKNRCDFTDKEYSVIAWKNSFGGGNIIMFSGNRGHVSPVKKSCIGFKDSTVDFTLVEYPQTGLPKNVCGLTSTINSDGHIIGFGGWKGEESLSSSCVLNVNELDKGWTSGVTLPKAMCFASTTTCTNGQILLAGGGETMWQGSEVYSDVFLLTQEGDWTRCSPMSEERCGHVAVTLLDSKIFVAGGYGGSSVYHSSTEMYDPQCDRWINYKYMNSGRTGLGLAVCPYGAVYAVGGSDDGALGTASVIRTDPREGKWCEVARMRLRRAYTAACFGGSGTLFVSGGINGNTQSSLVEWFDPRKPTAWSPMPNILVDEFRDEGTILLYKGLMRNSHQMQYVMTY